MPGTVLDAENKTMEKTDPCLVGAPGLASVRGGMKSLVFHSCGFIFCLSTGLQVWLVSGEAEVRSETVGGHGLLVWAGRQVSWGVLSQWGECHFITMCFQRP